MKLYLYDINQFDSKTESYLQIAYPRRYDFCLQFGNYKDYVRSMSAYLLLDKYLGHFSEDDIFYGENGKPYIKGKMLFNYSHNGDYVAFVKDKNEVGVDIEEISTSHSDLIAKHFTDKERELCLKNREKNFAMIWSKKESVIKLLGESIITNLKDLDVSGKEVEYRGKKIFVDQKFFDNYSIALATFNRQIIEIVELK